MKIFFSILFTIPFMVFSQTKGTNFQEQIKLQQLFLEAISNENYSEVETLLQNHKIDLNDYYEGKTLLIYASIQNKSEMVRLLCLHGADPTKRCIEGYTPKQHAIANNAYQAAAEIVLIIA